TRALISGTDILLFQEAAGERIYFDTSKTFEAPLYGRTLAGGIGLTVPMQGSNLTNIARLYRASTNWATQRLLIQELDLLGLFNKSFVQKTFDRAGHLLEERTGVLRKPTDFQSLFSAFTNSPSRVYSYQYQPGTWIAGADPESGVAVWTFTNAVPAGSAA